MLYQSKHLRVTAEYETATLWLGFPGEPVNALDIERLRELDLAISAVAAMRRVRILVVRSAIPAGFCGGIHPHALASLTHPSTRAAFAWYGHQVLERLAALDAITVAVIDGPCLGAGFELALACDYRVCVARPTTHLGFPDRFACGGGSTRVRQLAGRRGTRLIESGETLSGREGRALRLVDVACCERRARIELRTLLDRLESRPIKPTRPAEARGLAAERRRFSQMSTPVFAALETAEANSLPEFPDVVGLEGDDGDAARLAGEVALRGGSVVTRGGGDAVFAVIDSALSRGFITPLEAGETRARVQVVETSAGLARARLVFVSPARHFFPLTHTLAPSAIVCQIWRGEAREGCPPLPPLRSRRFVDAMFTERTRLEATGEPRTTAILAAWLRPYGITTVTRVASSQDLSRAA